MAKNNNRNVDPLPLTPEEMKAIGEIELGPSRHEQFLNAHYKKLIVALIGVMLLASAAIVYTTWRATQESNAAAAAVAAVKVPTGAVSAAEYDPVVLEGIAAEYPSTRAAATAQLLRGMELLAGGHQASGIEKLQSVIDSAQDDFLRQRAQVTLALHYTENGDLDKAMSLWQAVAKSETSPWEPLALLSMGDIAVQQGNVDMARIYYTQLKEDCPTSPLNIAARQRERQLGVDAPVPEQPVSTPDKPQEDTTLPGWSSVLEGTSTLGQ